MCFFGWEVIVSNGKPTRDELRLIYRRSMALSLGVTKISTVMVNRGQIETALGKTVAAKIIGTHPGKETVDVDPRLVLDALGPEAEAVDKVSDDGGK